jgi:hypothetical protein
MFILGRDRLSPLARATASLGAVLVLALSVFSSSPELHGWLHSHESSAAEPAHPGPGHVPCDDEGCAVTLFSQGLLLPLALLSLVLAALIVLREEAFRVDRVAPEAPHYLRLPSQAPPQA